MIIVCPACGRRYRIDRSRLASGVRLRCSGCRQVFDSRLPAPPEMNRDADRPAPAAVSPQPQPAPQPPGGASSPTGSGPLVLIGDINRPFRTAAQKLLQALGCRVETFEQGDAVFRAAVNRRPELLMLNTRLPGLSGTAVCEGVKGSPHLKSIKVVLVASTIQPADTGQETRPGFEPDDHFEDTISEWELKERLAQLLRGAIPDPARDAPAPIPIRASPRPPSPVGVTSQPLRAVMPAAPGKSPIASMAAVAPESSASVENSEEPVRPPVREIDPRDALDPAAEIERLARIMLSDLKLYNPSRFAAAVHDGRLLETFQSELLRGKDLITTRFPDLPNRMALLTSALRQGIEEEQRAAGVD